MSFKPSLRAHIAKAFNMLRLRWTQAEFSVPPTLAAAPELPRGLSGYCLFGPRSELPRGWYMVELRVRAHVVKIRGIVVPGSVEQSGVARPLEFPIHAGRTCKRVVRLKRPEMLRVGIDMAQGDFQIEHFRVSRLTESFRVAESCEN